MFKLYLMTICGCALYVLTAMGQNVTGNLEGKVLGNEGQPLQDVNIIVAGENLQGQRGSASDGNGWYRVLALPVGSYTVTVSHIAYQEVLFEEVIIRLGKTTTIEDIQLIERSIDIPAIVVTVNRPLIDHTSTASGGNLDMEEYRALPVQRDYRNIATLLPHANDSFLGDGVNYAGATGLENKYFIDGVETTDPYLGITGTRLPYNLVRELEVKVGGYEAEYRSSLGGIINVITYSGSNEFHGQIFGFYANNQFSGDTRRPALAPPNGDYSEYDFGLSIGGPLIRDRLWFFAAYNPTINREDVMIPGIGFYEDHSTAHIFAVKLTWQAYSNTNIVFSVFGDPSKRDAVGETTIPLPTPSAFVNPDPYLMNIERGGINMLLKATHILNNNIFIESSIARITRKEINQPATLRGQNEALYLDGPTGTWSGGSSSRIDNLSVQTTFQISSTILFDRHTLKSGFEFRDNQLDNDVLISIGGQRAPDLFIIQSSAEKGKFKNRIPSVFAQDSWLISDRFRLNIGFRWDGQYLIGSDGKVAQKITDQYQPRIGLIYQPGKTGSQKLYGSFSRFYQNLALFLPTKHLNDQVFDQAIIFDHDYRIDPSGGDTTSASSGSIQTEVEDLQGQYYDEYTLGYEQEAGQNFKIGVRGTYKILRQGIENSFVPDRSGDFLYGNPGSGRLDIYPKMSREYTAVELTLQKSDENKYNLFASYVLSRTYGNYAGLFTSDIVPQAYPNANGAFNLLAAMDGASGLLPNDRTHVFKFSGSYRFDIGLSVGTSFFWQSGKPKSEFGFNQKVITNYFIKQRGTAGRLSSLWDLNLRFSYDLIQLTKSWWKPRLIMDIFHIGSQRKPVSREEVHFNAIDDDGNPIAPNPNYDSPVLFQPPMTVKFGLEIDF